MTNPDLGSAEIEVHANTAPFERELETGIREGAEEAEASHKETGRGIGDNISEGMGDTFRKRGGFFGRKIKEGIDKEGGLSLDADINVPRSRFRRLRRTFAMEINDAFEEGFEHVVEPGGPIDLFGRGLSDAVGAAFNVSGRSSLIALLIPAIGAVVGLVGALISQLQVLGLLLGQLPTLLAAVGLQVVVLVVAFKAVSDAIKGAFAAQNAKELNEALKGLSKPARDFVLALLPLKNLLKDLRLIIELNFFKALGTNIGKLIQDFQIILRPGFRDLALALGGFFHQLIDFLDSPVFKEFAVKLFASTAEWVKTFGPMFIKFLDGLFRFINATMPLLDKFGFLFSVLFAQIGSFLEIFTSDKARFDEWSKTVGELLDQFFRFMPVLLAWLGSFISVLNDEGGERFLNTITDALESLIMFFESPAGRKAVQGLIDLVVLLTWSFIGMIYVISLFLDLIWVVKESIRQFFVWLRDWIEDIGEWFNNVKEKIRKVPAALNQMKDEFIATLKNLPARLVEIGRNAVQGLIDGIRQKFGPLISVAQNIASIIGRFLPGSPAEEGPLSGSGYTYLRGKRMIDDLASGIEAEAKTLNQVSNQTMGSINFGPGSIRVESQGTMSPEQARITGSAVGAGIVNTLAARNTRLAIRTL